MPGEGAKAQPSPTNIGGITAQTVSLSGSTATNYKAKYNYKCWERERKHCLHQLTQSGHNRVGTEEVKRT